MSRTLIPVPPDNVILEVQVAATSDCSNETVFLMASLRCQSCARLVLISGLARTITPDGTAVPDWPLSQLATDDVFADAFGQPGTLGDGDAPANFGPPTTWVMRDGHGGFDVVYRLAESPGRLFLKPLFSLRPDFQPRSIAAARLLFPGDLDRALALVDRRTTA